MPAAIPDEIAPLAFLLGRWQGQGIAIYPTMNAPVPYREELGFDHVGDPFLRYEQESWTAEDEPLHFERGFWRLRGDALEVTLAHPLGLAEVAHGRLTGSRIELASDGAIGRTATGSAVTGLRRRYRVEGDVLGYEIEMAMDEVPFALHLRAELRRR
jgi:hypothetical protein